MLYDKLLFILIIILFLKFVIKIVLSILIYVLKKRLYKWYLTFIQLRFFI